VGVSMERSPEGLLFCYWGLAVAVSLEVAAGSM
jgi:hypothetical protein